MTCSAELTSTGHVVRTLVHGTIGAIGPSLNIGFLGGCSTCSNVNGCTINKENFICRTEVDPKMVSLERNREDPSRGGCGIRAWCVVWS